MTRKNTIFCLLAGAAFLATAASAHADSKLVSGKRFMSLQATRGGIAAGVSQMAKTSQVHRSDAKAMRSGFMRLDRDLVINAARTPRVVRSSAQAPEAVAMLKANDAPVVTRGSAVTDLFGDNGGTDAPVFGRTLRTKHTASRSGHIWPIAQNVTQKISSGYGMRKDPFHGKQRFHGGIDIAAATGTPVLATASGTVTDVGNGRGLGQYVTVAHNDGSESTYGHLSAQNVREGQRVSQGQTVGKLGSTGRSTGPHLDYRIKKNGQRIDPMLVLNAPTGRTTKVAQVIQVR